jgi:glutathionyl-hydroquinone reductase
MGLLVEGKWVDRWYDTGKSDGAFQRDAAKFRKFVAADGASGFKAEAGRYHLYLAMACPWCHRALMMRTLKKLEDAITISYVEPLMLEEGWVFASPEPITGAQRAYEIYLKANPTYTGRVTVPILWDKKTNTIVNNESSEIIRMLNTEFTAVTDDRTDYYPAPLAAEIDAINARVYDTVNNGVYKAGFATRQEPYENAVRELFASLDWLEEILSKRRYLLGAQVTEADIRLFPTLVRFDAVYYGHFKCNLRHVYEYPALWRYTRDLHALPGVAATVEIDIFKQHYYGSHKSINPSGVIPLGPRISFD